jgi:hypothetical protein
VVFHGAQCKGEDGFFAFLLRQQKSYKQRNRAASLKVRPVLLLFAVSRRRSGCVPAEPYPPLKQSNFTTDLPIEQSKNPNLMHYSGFASTHSGFARTASPLLIAPRQAEV